MVHVSTSTALYLATATLLGAVVLPASLDLAATHLGRSGLVPLAQVDASEGVPSTPALDTWAKPAWLASAGVLHSE